MRREPVSRPRCEPVASKYKLEAPQLFVSTADNPHSKQSPVEHISAAAPQLLVSIAEAHVQNRRIQNTFQ